MIVREGRLDYKRLPRGKEFLLFTGNAYVREDGALVMGRGAAKEVRDHHKGIDKWFGKEILDWGVGKYGIIIHSRRIGVFQVKHNYRDEADLNLIEHSAGQLYSLAYTFPNMTFQMNYPGVGNGGLATRDVQQVLDAVDIPDNVTLWL